VRPFVRARSSIRQKQSTLSLAVRVRNRSGWRHDVGRRQEETKRNERELGTEQLSDITPGARVSVALTLGGTHCHRKRSQHLGQVARHQVTSVRPIVFWSTGHIDPLRRNNNSLSPSRMRIVDGLYGGRQTP